MARLLSSCHDGLKETWIDLRDATWIPKCWNHIDGSPFLQMAPWMARFMDGYSRLSTDPQAQYRLGRQGPYLLSPTPPPRSPSNILHLSDKTQISISSTSSSRISRPPRIYTRYSRSAIASHNIIFDELRAISSARLGTGHGNSDFGLASKERRS